MGAIILAALITVTAPTTNADGTPLDDLAGIRLYLANGTEVGYQPLTQPGSKAEFTYPINVMFERKCFNAVAEDTSGNASAPTGGCSTRWRCYSCHKGAL